MTRSPITYHAEIRIAERTSLSNAEFMLILDKKLYVELGSKPGINKSHGLFYSPPDDDFYVAIIDSLNGDILTVLPSAYHNRLAWHITKDNLVLAKSLWNNKSLSDLISIEEKQSAKSIHFRVHVYTKEDKIITKTVKKFATKTYGHSIDSLISRLDVVSIAKEYLKLREISYNCKDYLSLRVGSSGDPYIIYLEDD